MTTSDDENRVSFFRKGEWLYDLKLAKCTYIALDNDKGWEGKRGLANSDWPVHRLFR